VELGFLSDEGRWDVRDLAQRGDNWNSSHFQPGKNVGLRRHERRHLFGDRSKKRRISA